MEKKLLTKTNELIELMKQYEQHLGEFELQNPDTAYTVYSAHVRLNELAKFLESRSLNKKDNQFY